MSFFHLNPTQKTIFPVLNHLFFWISLFRSPWVCFTRPSFDRCDELATNSKWKKPLEKTLCESIKSALKAQWLHPHLKKPKQNSNNFSNLIQLWSGYSLCSEVFLECFYVSIKFLKFIFRFSFSSSCVHTFCTVSFSFISFQIDLQCLIAFDCFVSGKTVGILCYKK